MAQQGALLVGGTGYQYGDTEFLEYSERLYLELRQPAARGQRQHGVAVGKALVQAKQRDLASLATKSGIDQKRLLQATLYGLPMTGFDAPGRNPHRRRGRWASSRPAQAYCARLACSASGWADKDRRLRVSDPDIQDWLDGCRELTWL